MIRYFNSKRQENTSLLGKKPVFGGVFAAFAGALACFSALTGSVAAQDFGGIEMSCSLNQNSVLDIGVINPIRPDPDAFSVDLRPLCKSWKYEAVPNSTMWRSTGAYCLTMDVAGGGSYQERYLYLDGTDKTRKIVFNIMDDNRRPLGDGNGNGFGMAGRGRSAAIGQQIAGGFPINFNSHNLLGQIYKSEATISVGTYSNIYTFTLHYGTGNNIDAPLNNQYCAQSFGALREVRSLRVIARVEAACEFSKTKDIDFGDQFDLSRRELTEIGELSVQCNDNAPYSITLDGGYSKDPYNRQMYLNGNTAASSPSIRYEIERPNGGGFWGDEANTGYKSTANGQKQLIPVKVRIPIQTTPTTGSYRDSIKATLTF